MAHPALARIAKQDPLLARVLADPDDAGLRSVWADALIERDDPRGELISIQALAGDSR
ncbi:MAG TPA: TIGR02996 domain-containing protein [Kofleriaceae bacterium]|nr:TIGR02996 domain-containing protein [Kofleriaceae bacterium]